MVSWFHNHNQLHVRGHAKTINNPLSLKDYKHQLDLYTQRLLRLCCSSVEYIWWLYSASTTRLQKTAWRNSFSRQCTSSLKLLILILILILFTSPYKQSSTCTSQLHHLLAKLKMNEKFSLFLLITVVVVFLFLFFFFFCPFLLLVIIPWFAPLMPDLSRLLGWGSWRGSWFFPLNLIVTRL